MTFYWGWVFSWSYAISGFGATLDQNWFLGTSVFNLFFLTTFCWGWVFSWSYAISGFGATLNHFSQSFEANDIKNLK